MSWSKIMHGSRRFHRQRLRPRQCCGARTGRGDLGRHARGQAAFGPMTMGLRRPVERELEMKARNASAAFARTRAAPERGGSTRALQAPAAPPASRSRATRYWRRSDSNHPTPADAVGRPAPASRAPWWTRPTSGRCRLAAVARDHPGANGRTKRSSATRAQTAPILPLIEFSIGTNSLNPAAVSGRPTLTEFPAVEECGKQRRRERIAYLRQLRRFFGHPSPPSPPPKLPFTLGYFQ